MMKPNKQLKIVYCTPSLYMAGGVERVLTLKANYFADHYGYDVTIIVTDGKNKSSFFTLSDCVKVVNLDINFEELWHRNFIMRVYQYVVKQRQYKHALSKELYRIHPDITISTLRREINFISDIKDGSKKIGEIHINRAHYRNFTPNRSNLIKKLFAKSWMRGLLEHVKKLDRFVVLTEYDRQAWQEIPRVEVIPNPLPFYPIKVACSRRRRIIAVGRYFDEKGYDLLIKAWSIIEKECDDWELDIYGDGCKSYYERIVDDLNINRTRCRLNDSIKDVQKEYLDSSFFVCTSRFEGFGMGIIEAMACGLPVVAFDCLWGPRSIISDGEDGLLVENGNIVKLAETMLFLIYHPLTIAEMGQKAIINVSRFNIDTIAMKWKRLFESL